MTDDQERAAFVLPKPAIEGSQYDSIGRVNYVRGFSDRQMRDAFEAGRASLRSELAAAPAVAWISVEDQLPEDGQHVAVLYWPYDNRNNNLCVDGTFYEARTGTFLTDVDGDDHHFPSHWMPLPPPPIDTAPGGPAVTTTEGRGA